MKVVYSNDDSSRTGIEERIPSLIRDLFEAARWLGDAFVASDPYAEREPQMLAALFSAAARSVDANALVVPRFQLGRQRIDLAIFTRGANLAIVFHTYEQEVRDRISHLGNATLPFDYVLLVDGSNQGGNAALDILAGRARSWPYLLRTPDHMLSFCYASDGDDVAFVCLQRQLPSHWSTPRSPSDLAKLLFCREQPKRALGPSALRQYIRRSVAARSGNTSLTVLTGQRIADALVGYLASRSAAPASIIREAYLAPFGGSVADCLHVQPAGIHLYEIKGETDQPTRLANQIDYYDGVGTTCTLVTTRRQAAKYVAMIPPHWGLLIATSSKRGRASFTVDREAQTNPHRTGDRITDMMRSPTLAQAVTPFGKSTRSVNGMRAYISETMDVEMISALAARDCAQRYGGGGLRKSQVVQIGDHKAWPTIRHILGIPALFQRPSSDDRTAIAPARSLPVAAAATAKLGTA